jgi:hypothetical protein
MACGDHASALEASFELSGNMQNAGIDIGAARAASGSINTRKSRFRGVSWDTRYSKWRVRITCLGAQHHVGR